jgi:hypothetical protein
MKTAGKYNVSQPHRYTEHSLKPVWGLTDNGLNDYASRGGTNKQLGDDNLVCRIFVGAFWGEWC